MTTTHTPGPWRIDADGVVAGDPEGFQPFGSCGCCGSPWMSGDSDDQKRADARLIAAAPELLTALQEAYSVIVAEVADGEDTPLATSIRELVAKVIA